MEQLQLDGMPRRLYSCTPTRLGTWLDCPRRYRMTYLDRPAPPKGPPWAHNSLGASVHNALAAWWRLARPGRTVTAAGDLLESGWLTDGYASDAQSAEYRQRSRTLVEEYVTGLDPDREPVGVERTVATRTEKIAVSGRIDRLDSRPAGDQEALVVVDYKTGRYVPTVDDARSSMALALYALAAQRVLRRPCRRVELHHLPSRPGAGLGAHPRGAGPAAGAGRGHRAGVRGGRRGVPGAGTGGRGRPRRCSRPGRGRSAAWCDFRAHCPEGRAATESRLPWDGLAPRAVTPAAEAPRAGGSWLVRGGGGRAGGARPCPRSRSRTWSAPGPWCRAPRSPGSARRPGCRRARPRAAWPSGPGPPAARRRRSRRR